MDNQAILKLVTQAVQIEHKYQELDKAGKCEGPSDLSREICRSIIRAYVTHTGMQQCSWEG